ncbi:MAG: hypothetical protein DIU61_013495 [Bacteroidota bacterium]|jgi:hypothetical protein|nr:MAG: hypothetical protein DIU61_17635 [Bacteroidota bacterium]
MKTSNSFPGKGWHVTFSACVLILSSCHSYRPLAGDTALNDVMYQIDPGKRYAITIRGGQTVYIRVDSVDVEHLTGRARIRVGPTTVRSSNYTIYRENILSVRKRKTGFPFTILDAIGAVIFTGLMFYEPAPGRTF